MFCKECNSDTHNSKTCWKKEQVKKVAGKDSKKKDKKKKNKVKEAVSGQDEDSSSGENYESSEE